jgi:hypothetical protein
MGSGFGFGVEGKGVLGWGGGVVGVFVIWRNGGEGVYGVFWWCCGRFVVDVKCLYCVFLVG